MESKKIKKMARVNKNLVARFKKSNARPERAQVGVVHKPSRLFADNEVLVMESVRVSSPSPLLSYSFHPLFFPSVLTLLGFLLWSQ